jgi:hypothetical protein
MNVMTYQEIFYARLDRFWQWIKDMIWRIVYNKCYNISGDIFGETIDSVIESHDFVYNVQ